VLIDECIRDAKLQDQIGIAVIISKKAMIADIVYMDHCTPILKKLL